MLGSKEIIFYFRLCNIFNENRRRTEGGIMGGDIFSILMSVSRKGPLGNFIFRFHVNILFSPF